MIDVLLVAPEMFHRTPQIGRPFELGWDELKGYLSRPSVGDAKDVAGAWSPALYRNNVRRKSALLRVGAVVFDFDENGDVDEVATLLAPYSAIVHETFSSTNDAPRGRAVIELAEAVDAAVYEQFHAIARRHFAAAGMPADEGAKDASRLSYAPVRRAGAGYRLQTLHGAPLDVHTVLAAQPPPPPRPIVRPPAPEHRDAYVRGALRRAADAVGSASDGSRHYTLCKEAYALARLGLSAFEVERALLPAFVGTAGEARQREGIRTIRDALVARRGAA